MDRNSGGSEPRRPWLAGDLANHSRLDSGARSPCTPDVRSGELHARVLALHSRGEYFAGSPPWRGASATVGNERPVHRRIRAQAPLARERSGQTFTTGLRGALAVHAGRRIG